MTGLQLRKLRESYGLTQKQLAELIGLPGKSAISLMENGKRPIRKWMAFCLPRLLEESGLRKRNQL